MSNLDSVLEMEWHGGKCFLLAAAWAADAYAEDPSFEACVAIGTLSQRPEDALRVESFTHAWVELPDGVLIAPTATLEGSFFRDAYYEKNDVCDVKRIHIKRVAKRVAQYGLTPKLIARLLADAGYKYRVVNGSVLPA